MRPSVALVILFLSRSLWSFITRVSPIRKTINVRITAVTEHKDRIIDSSEAFFPRVTKRFSSLPFPLLFKGPRKVIMRRRPPAQSYRGRRQLNVGIDGLVHPREDYYENRLQTSNGIDLQRLGLDVWFYLDGLDPELPISMIPANTTLPPGLCLIHKKCRDYCIETSEVCTLETFNKRMKIFHDSLVQMNQTELFQRNREYWDRAYSIARTELEGFYVYHDDC